jgi:aerobic-type carbon monoxide dehydrogenase small subunit (CoxS/CutS family)
MSGQNYPIKLQVNGEWHELQVAAQHSLLQVLRDQLNLTGTKECCNEGECGACTIFLNGRSVTSCLILAVEVDGSSITTIEGLAQGDQLDPLQESFLEHGAVQCGFCIPGMIMSSKYLLEKNPKPNHEEVQEGLSGNLCRCAGYDQIIEAVLSTAEKANEVQS